MNQVHATLKQAIDLALERGAAELRVSMPGRIERFDAAKQLADVKPLLKDTVFDDGSEVAESLPVVPGVPVQFVGGGGYAETWPVAVGDTCLLVVTDRNIDRWFSNGGEVDPVDLGRHLLNSAVALLGVRDSTAVLAEFDTSRAVWGNKGPRIAADGSAIHLGVAHQENGTQDLIRGSQFLTELDALFTSLDSNDTAASVALNAAGAGLIAAAPLNAVPMYGGALASPTIIQSGTQLNNAGAQVAANVTARATFKAKWNLYSTDKVKLP